MAGTIILVVSVLLWALSTFPGGTIETSYLGLVGQKLEPLGRMMGLDWQMLVALLTSFVRKENTIPTLAVLYGVGTQGAGLAEVLGSHLTQPAALAFLAVQMLFIPCMATLADHPPGNPLVALDGAQHGAAAGDLTGDGNCDLPGGGAGGMGMTLQRLKLLLRSQKTG